MQPSKRNRFGLIGYPLTHSFSRRYFTAKFERESIDARYANYPIEAIEQFIDVADTPGLVGLNVTKPYKQAVLPYLDSLSPEARQVGAVNTILFTNGSKTGYNTDVHGCAYALQKWLNNSIGHALVLGTGGAARAVCFVMDQMKIAYKTVSRRATKGDLTFEELTPEMLREYQLIVNTTPLGMAPGTDTCPPIPYHAITPGHFLFDLVYNPEKTLFLKRGEQQGARIKNGLEMLHSQADRAWEIWKPHLKTTHDIP